MNLKVIKQLDKITNSLLKDDPDYAEWSARVGDLDELYKEQYGKSKKSNRNNYAINQFKDLRKRSGNKLLSELKLMDSLLLTKYGHYKNLIIGMV